MNKENLGNAFEKLVKNFVGDKYGVDYHLEPIEHYEDKPHYDLTVYIDPNQYHWMGSDYSKKYHDVIEDIEEEIDKALKYLGAHSWEFINDIEYRRTKDSDNFYKYLKEKIKEVWPKVRSLYLEKTNPYLIPDILDVKFDHEGRYDDIIIILDTPHVHPSYYDQSFWHMFFVYTAKYDLPLDTFRVDIKGYED
jgi:hypothetical protein